MRWSCRRRKDHVGVCAPPRVYPPLHRRQACSPSYKELSVEHLDGHETEAVNVAGWLHPDPARAVSGAWYSNRGSHRTGVAGVI